MSITTPTSAERNGQAWGMRARDWSEVETQQRPTYERRSAAPASAPGQTVLDVGCGSGAFLRAAADHGADRLRARRLARAARDRPRARARGRPLPGRPPAAPLRRRQLRRRLGFNSFFFADDMVAALREAGRVAKPGAPVVIQVWGRPEALRPAPDEGRARALHAAAPGRAGSTRPTLWQPGVLEPLAIAGGAHPRPRVRHQLGLRVRRRGRARAGDDARPAASARSSAPTSRQAARDAIVEALAVCRTPDCGYRMENEWHFLIARAA